MYSMVTIANNTVLHLKVSKRVDLKSPHHKKKFFVIMVVVIILQCIPTSSHHVETNIILYVYYTAMKISKISCYLNVCKNYLL